MTARLYRTLVSGRLSRWGTGYWSCGSSRPKISFRSLTTGSSEDGTTDPQQQPSASSSNTSKSSKFPWRHEEDLLPRLRKDSSEFLEFYRSQGYISQTVVANSMLGTPWVMEKLVIAYYVYGTRKAGFWSALFDTDHWKKDLAQNTAWAFSRGMGQLLSETYNVPLQDVISDEDETVNFIFINDALKDDESETINETTSSSNTLETFMGKEIIGLHQKFREEMKESEGSKPKIVLQFQPYSSEVLSITTMPLARKAIDRDEGAREIQRTILSTPIQDRIGMVMENFNSGEWKGIYIAEVLVWCHECFSITSSSDEIKPQEMTPRSIPHLVRITTSLSLDNEGEIEFENWRIVDIDDLGTMK